MHKTTSPANDNNLYDFVAFTWRFAITVSNWQLKAGWENGVIKGIDTKYIKCSYWRDHDVFSFALLHS